MLSLMKNFPTALNQHVKLKGKTQKPNVIKLVKACHSEERSDAGIRSKSWEKRIAAPLRPQARTSEQPAKPALSES